MVGTRARSTSGRWSRRRCLHSCSSTARSSVPPPGRLWPTSSVLAASRSRSRRFPRISGRGSGVCTPRRSRARSWPRAARGCSSGSGACPLLPAIGAAIDGTVSAYVLVDGDLPLAPGSGGSRIDLLRAAAPALADELEALLSAGRSFPTWGTRICWRRSPTNDCGRRLWRRSARSRASFGPRLCRRSPAGRTRRVDISSSAPTMRQPLLERGSRDGDIGTSAADTSRCSCGPLTSPTRSSS
jgi:hypothetical protein